MTTIDVDCRASSSHAFGPDDRDRRREPLRFHRLLLNRPHRLEPEDHAPERRRALPIVEPQAPEIERRLLVEHYDPAYRRSSHKNFTHLAHAHPVQIARADDAAFSVAAASLLDPALVE